MSTPTTDPTPAPAVPTDNGQPAASANPTPAPPASQAPAAPAQETDWKAEARKWEQRAKENTEAAKRLAEIEEASKTEAQKQAERAAQLEAKVKEYETREQIAAWKDEVAKATGVPAKALAGSTKEEIEAHAETLKSLIVKAPETATVPPVGPTVPGQQPGGTQAPALVTQSDLDALGAAGKYDEINRLRREGRLSHLGVAPPKKR